MMSVLRSLAEKLAALLILVMNSPVFLICVLLVRFTSKGPIFHISERVGASNVNFQMVKFRTMRIDTPQVATHLLQDPKTFLTPVGAFLRRTSLDELPQLFNIIKGEMVFVGPRPALFNQYDQIELRTESGCHVLTPGVTGWAQVNGRDEISIEEKVRLDSWYFENRSWRLDLKILWLTFSSVLLRKGVSH